MRNNAGDGCDAMNAPVKGGRSSAKDPVGQSAGPRVVNVRQAGDCHQVVTVVGGKGVYRRKPCETCPWKVSSTGEFPAEAFRHSAGTAYDMAGTAFSCHQAGAERPAICAGFLLRGADHNLAVRMKRMKGEIVDDVSDGGEELFENYRAMAVANGVDEDDPVLRPCRD